jgi:hypothetical protein
MENTTPISTEVVAGTAKKMTLELEKMPLHSHAAIVTTMNLFCEHRQANEKMAMAAKQQEAYKQQLAYAEEERIKQASGIVLAR